MTIQSVLLVVAMGAEASPIVQKLGLIKDDPPVIASPTSMETFSGQFGGLKVHLAHNGRCPKFDVDLFGTNAATLTTYLAIQAFKPCLVISAGTAGGFKSQGGEIASIIVSTSIVNHDRRIPIPKMDAFGIGKEETHSVAKMATDLGMQQGVVSTGNSLDYTAECLKIMAEQNAAAKDMEAAAVAFASRTCSTPMIAIKAITDIVDGGRPTNEEFLENLGRSAAALQAAIVKVLAYLDGKTLAEL